MAQEHHCSYSKKKVKDRLEGQTRGICVQDVLAKWYVGCLTVLLEMRNIDKRDKSWECIHTFGLKEGRAITLMAAAAREWGPELGVNICSMDAKQALYNVSPESLRDGNCSCVGRSNFEGADWWQI